MIRIDPAARPLWRTPDSLQLGWDPALAVLEAVPPGAEAVLGALVDGVDRAGLDAAALRAQLPAAGLDRLLHAVSPALLPAPEPLPPALRVVLDAPADLAGLLRGLLELDPAAGGDGDPDLVLVAAHHLVPPPSTVRHLIAGVPHLAVVFGDQALGVGPLVRPGRTPCLRCAEEHRLDAPHHRAVAAQLLRRTTSRTAHRVRVRLRAATLVADALVARREGRDTGLEGVEVRLAPDGSVSRRPRPWHDRCPCRRDGPPA